MIFAGANLDFKRSQTRERLVHHSRNFTEDSKTPLSELERK